MKEKIIISEEVADEQIETLLDYYDFSLEDLSDDERKAIDSCLKKIKRAIRKGSLEISTDNGLTIIQTLVRPPGDVQTLTYGRASGKQKSTMKDSLTNYEKCYQLVGSMTGLGAKAIANLDLVDIKICEALGMLFLSI